MKNKMETIGIIGYIGFSASLPGAEEGMGEWIIGTVIREYVWTTIGIHSHVPSSGPGSKAQTTSKPLMTEFKVQGLEFR